jgi:hypothetical protein
MRGSHQDALSVWSFLTVRTATHLGPLRITEANEPEGQSENYEGAIQDTKSMLQGLQDEPLKFNGLAGYENTPEKLHFRWTKFRGAGQRTCSRGRRLQIRTDEKRLLRTSVSQNRTSVPLRRPGAKCRASSTDRITSEYAVTRAQPPREIVQYQVAARISGRRNSCRRRLSLGPRFSS